MLNTFFECPYVFWLMWSSSIAPAFIQFLDNNIGHHEFWDDKKGTDYHPRIFVFWQLLARGDNQPVSCPLTHCLTPRMVFQPFPCHLSWFTDRDTTTLQIGVHMSTGPVHMSTFPRDLSTCAHVHWTCPHAPLSSLDLTARIGQMRKLYITNKKICIQKLNKQKY